MCRVCVGILEFQWNRIEYGMAGDFSDTVSLLDVFGLFCKYDASSLRQDLNFEMRPGQRLSKTLLGPSGKYCLAAPNFGLTPRPRIKCLPARCRGKFRVDKRGLWPEAFQRERREKNRRVEDGQKEGESAASSSNAPHYFLKNTLLHPHFLAWCSHKTRHSFSFHLHSVRCRKSSMM